MINAEEQKTISALQANWVWTPDWVDASQINTAGRIVKFTREFELDFCPGTAYLYFTADTRYKLYINGTRVAVGPSRSSPWIWYYDMIDIGPFLNQGRNVVTFVVLRYFAASRSAMPFSRTSNPGFTVTGTLQKNATTIDLSSKENWQAQVDDSVLFPTGVVDDGFLHINERISQTQPNPPVTPVPYDIKTLNGELSPWRLRPRIIPMPEESRINVNTIHSCQSLTSKSEWTAYLSGQATVTLEAGSSHTLEVQAEVHSTAFLQWAFRAEKQSSIRLKITYSEGYELEPRNYPFFRSKADRLDADKGYLIGPYDEVTIDLPSSQMVRYEPFWFRTFRMMRLEITAGAEPIELLSFNATQVNYPLNVKASWSNPGDKQSKQIWDVSIRTLRNCMFDGYSDCPFYEQLQYSGDSRSVGLFHYLLSGDDRLMRQAITNFAASTTTEGLTQSRFPSHVPQIIAGFSLYWILQVCDHHLYFGDTPFTRSFLPRIDGVLEFFATHVDSLGLVSGLPEDVWQYVDWVTTWGATDAHPDKGVPTAGRTSNRHTFFSMLYSLVLYQAARLARAVGRPGHANEYESRADLTVKAIHAHCFDGRFFTDSTADVVTDTNGPSYSQHCQVFGVLCGAVDPNDRARLLRETFIGKRPFSKCSYVMQFYVLRAFAMAGDEAYEAFWPTVWNPWRKMLADNLSTWEEDNVRQRSDCHAWGSVPLYEYCTELAGIQPTAPGCKALLFKPRLLLSDSIVARVALGKDNVATVSWETEIGGEKHIDLRLEKPILVSSILPRREEQKHGVVKHLEFTWSPC